MLRFASPEHLYLLPFLALLAAGTWWQLRRLALRRVVLADEGLLSDLGAPTAGVERRRWQAFAAIAALATWAVALANPQYGTRTRLAATRSTEVIVALDISQSMRTQDVRPDRLSRAQLFLEDLLRALAGERVGLVLFAGQAYLQMPLTSDYAAAIDLIRGAAPEKATTQGTNTAAALGMAHRVLVRPVPEGAPPPAPARRIVVVVSDGENHEPGATQAAETLAADGLRVITVGVGTAGGGLVPSAAAPDAAYRRDDGGEPVTSQFDPAALQALAEDGGGRYYDLNRGPRAVAQEVAQYIDAENLGGGTEERFEERASYYQLFVAAGLLLWAWAWWLGRAKPSALSQTLSPS